MKILVISFLRLGDGLQLLPVLEGLRDKFGAPLIDMLTFKPLGALHALRPDVRRWWTLDRDDLQAGLGRPEHPLLTSFEILRESLAGVAAEDYDLIINLTQTEFAGWVAGYLPSRAKLGFSFDLDGRACFHSPWFRYLNEITGHVAENTFNYTDLFFEASELGGRAKRFLLTETARGRAEVAALELDARPILAVQTATSDSKKTWGEAAWAAALKGLADPSRQIVLLGAPAEREDIERLAAASGATAAILSLEGALSLLQNSAVLLTGDTSIKHLATAARTRVVELSLGSSDWRRTGTYKQDSLILNPQPGCAPCPHAGTCARPTHACAESLSAALVVDAVEAFWSSDWSELATLAGDNVAIKMYRTHHLETGYWFAGDLCRANSELTLAQWIDRSSWRVILNQEDRLSPIPPLGSEGVRLHRQWRALFPESDVKPMLEHLEFCERELLPVPVKSEAWRADIGRRPLAELRFQQNQENEQARRAEVKLKLIRACKSRLMECE